jgi:hypothetical protein
MGGLQSRSGCGGEERNSQPLTGHELPIIQPVDQRYTTELSRHVVYTINSLKTLVQKSEAKRPLGRPGRRGENIKMDLKDIGCERADWGPLIQEGQATAGKIERWEISRLAECILPPKAGLRSMVLVS